LISSISLTRLIMVHHPSLTLELEFSASSVIIGAAALALFWALLQFLIVARIPVKSNGTSEETGLVSGSNGEHTTERLIEIYTAIYEGAESFLRAEYSVCALFVVVFSAIIFFLVSWGTGDAVRGFFTTLSFVLGAVTSMISGYLGMKVAVYSNVNHCQCSEAWMDCMLQYRFPRWSCHGIRSLRTWNHDALLYYVGFPCSLPRS